jgi:hypothetical protein
MIDLSDEVLCQYIDGELDASTVIDVEQALALDAGARVRVERMRQADAMLRKSVPAPVVTNDDPWVQLIRNGTSAESSSLNVQRSGRARGNATWRPVFFASMAAGVSGIVCGALLAPNFLSGSAADNSLANMSTDSAKSFISTLDTIQSGSTFQRNDDTVRMILSFRANDGRHCRVFELSNPTGGAEGVACRNETHWQVVAWDATQKPTDGFRAAGASELIDGVMHRLGGDSALELSDEQKLIKNGWQ